jgi:hypothetical protein
MRRLSQSGRTHCRRCSHPRDAVQVEEADYSPYRSRFSLFCILWPIAVQVPAASTTMQGK